MQQTAPYEESRIQIRFDTRSKLLEKTVNYLIQSPGPAYLLAETRRDACHHPNSKPRVVTILATRNESELTPHVPRIRVRKKDERPSKCFVLRRLSGFLKLRAPQFRVLFDSGERRRRRGLIGPPLAFYSCTGSDPQLLPQGRFLRASDAFLMYARNRGIADGYAFVRPILDTEKSGFRVSAHFNNIIRKTRSYACYQWLTAWSLADSARFPRGRGIRNWGCDKSGLDRVRENTLRRGFRRILLNALLTSHPSSVDFSALRTTGTAQPGSSVTALGHCFLLPRGGRCL